MAICSPHAQPNLEEHLCTTTAAALSTAVYGSRRPALHRAPPARATRHIALLPLRPCHEEAAARTLATILHPSSARTHGWPPAASDAPVATLGPRTTRRRRLRRTRSR